jgi:6-phosphogluconolactonase
MPLLHDIKTSQICRWHDFENTTDLEHAVVAEILIAAHQAIDKRGAFHIVLAGGSTPKKVYAALRNATTNWAAWHIYFGDERCLQCEHDDRNSHMAALVWLDHVAIPSVQIHPIPAEQGATIAADKYAQEINTIITFDLVLLGLGEDGHTASLFPNHDSGDAPDAPATLIILDAPKPPPQRVSLSARRLSETHQLFFLVTGNSKAQAVKDWRTGIPIPATTIKPDAGVDIYLERTLLDFK